MAIRGASLSVGLDGPGGTWLSPVKGGDSGGKNTSDYNAPSARALPSGSPCAAPIARCGGGLAERLGDWNVRDITLAVARAPPTSSAGHRRCFDPRDSKRRFRPRGARKHHQFARYVPLRHRRWVHYQQTQLAKHPWRRSSASSCRCSTRREAGVRPERRHARSHRRRALLVLERGPDVNRFAEAGDRRLAPSLAAMSGRLPGRQRRASSPIRNVRTRTAVASIRIASRSTRRTPSPSVRPFRRRSYPVR